MTIIWTIVLVLAVIAESMTTALVAVWFIPGAVLAIVFSALNFPLWAQLLAFFLSGLGMLFRVAFREKLFKTKIVPTNADSLIGKRAIVIEEIDNLASKGAVKVGAAVWSARSESGEPIEADAVVEVVAIEGVKLICKK